MITSIFYLIFSFFIFPHPSKPLLEETIQIRSADLVAILQKDWEGELTYLDYTSNKKVSIPCNLEVSQTNSNSYTFKYMYPDEPHANHTFSMKLRKKGAYLDKQKVISYEEKDGTKTLVTSRMGKDDNKVAELHYTYRFNKKAFSIRKEVKPEGSNEFFFRNEYVFGR